MSERNPFRQLFAMRSDYVREYDERARYIDLLVMRDIFITAVLVILIASILLQIPMFRHLQAQSFALLPILIVGTAAIVGPISMIRRKGWSWKRQRFQATETLLVLPIYALVFFLINKLLGYSNDTGSLIATLVGVAFFPVLIVLLAWRKK